MYLVKTICIKFVDIIESFTDISYIEYKSHTICIDYVTVKSRLVGTVSVKLRNVLELRTQTI